MDATVKPNRCRSKMNLKEHLDKHDCRRSGLGPTHPLSGNPRSDYTVIPDRKFRMYPIERVIPWLLLSL